MALPQFTVLANNWLIAIISLFCYAIFGGFSHPILSFFLFSIISLWLVFLLSIPKNEDMDMLTAFCIHGRGVRTPKGESPMTMTQNCCIYFENKLNFDKIKTEISETFYRFRRFSHIGVLKNKNTPVWNTKWKYVEITDDIQNKMINKQMVNNNDELYELIDKLCNIHLPKQLPQWIFHYIENNDGESCWLIRISHGIADGIRLIPIISNILQDMNGNPCGAPQTGVLRSTNSIGAGNKNKVKRIGPRQSKIMWLNPKTYYNVIQDVYKIWYSINGQMDTINPFKPDNTIHGPKFQCHIRPKTPIKIADIKTLKNKYGVSFNDVITALTCSGIRSYILAKDSDFFKKNQKVSMTSCLAFGFPPKDEYYAQKDWLRNGFTMIDWSFPVDIADFEQRLKVINKNGKILKNSFVTPLGLGVTELLARLGFDTMLDSNFTQMFKRHTCVFSNLPTWSKPLYYDKVKVTKLEASYVNWIPQFIFISYNEYIYGTLIVDPQRFPNAQIILDGMNQEIIKQLK